MSKIHFMGYGRLHDVSEAVQKTVEMSVYRDGQFEELQQKHEKLTGLFGDLIQLLHERRFLNDDEVRQFVNYDLKLETVEKE